MKQRMTTNNLTTENVRLRTRIQMVEVELQRKDKVIDDLILQQETNFGLP
jgi:cell fate regulator YaaT (PSP1 superfamily)